MKKTFLILSLLSVLVAPVWAAEIPVTSKISKVTVYGDRAFITRTAEAELEKGDNTLVFEGLPASLLEESLKAEGKGSMATTLQGAELKKVFTPKTVNDRQRALQNELEKLQDERQVLEMKNQALQSQKSFLGSILNFSSMQVPKEIMTHMPPPADWTGLSQFVFTAYAQNGAEEVALLREMREKDKEIQAKQNEFSEIGGGSASEKKTVLVDVEAHDKGKFKIELSYLISQASWSLSYDAKVFPEKKSATLISYGNVRNWSGEDWAEVKLTLSSSKPSIGGKMPELAPWYLDIFQPYPMKAQRAEAKMRANAMFKDERGSQESVGAAAPAESEALSMDSVAPQAAVSQELGSVTFELGRQTTVTGDNHAYHLAVLTEEFPVTLDYEATPKLSSFAYLHTQIVNEKDHPLAAGPINIFSNDNYVGKSSIGMVGKGEKFDLYLGVDEEIKIKRTAVVDLTKKTLLGLRSRKNYAYNIEMENYKKEPASLKIIDQIPVSKNNDIKAEFVSANVKPDSKDLGRLEWQFVLQPAEKKKLEFQFLVEHPANQAISGV